MQSANHYTARDIEFLNQPKRLFIGGQWRAAVAGKQLDVINPATGQAIAAIASGESADIDRAVVAARSAFEGEWSQWTPYDRRRLLLKIHDLVERNFDELALLETLDMGAPLARIKAMKGWISQAILFYASQTGANTTETLANSMAGNINTYRQRAPIGVVGGIIPWNAPLVSQWWILGPTLATGCTAILKPAEDASLTVLRMAELLIEAGVPEGVINVVTGLGATAGAALAEHLGVDRVSFTGSTETGRKIIQASAANIKRVQLELGGKSPDIVFADANLDLAVPAAAMAVYGNSGQICTAGTRLLVQRSIYDEFLSRLQAFTATLKVGNGLDADTVMGPLISQKQLDRVLHYIDIGQSEGAVLSAGGKRPAGDLQNGYYVQPTIFSGVSNDMRIAREEIFGPVISLIPFDDFDDAIRIANDTVYGLAGGVWTTNLSTAHKTVNALNAGTVWVNCYGALDPNVGFGGAKASGYGWKGNTEHVESFTYQKAVYMNIG